MCQTPSGVWLGLDSTAAFYNAKNWFGMAFAGYQMPVVLYEEAQKLKVSAGTQAHCCHGQSARFQDCPMANLIH
jgi:hypothetical protein